MTVFETVGRGSIPRRGIVAGGADQRKQIVSGGALAAGVAPFTVATNLPAASALPLMFSGQGFDFARSINEQ